MKVFGARYPKIDARGAVVLVTGAGRGIGRATAELFARRGARVVLGDLDEPLARQAAHDIKRDMGRDALGARLDVTDRDSFAAFVDLATRTHGAIDVLVNNAGVMPLGPFLDEPERIGRWTLEVNVWGLIYGMRLVLPGMILRKRGHIVNVASMAGKLAIPGMATYNASKFAAVGLTKAVRREVLGSGVSVSAVLPGAVRTSLASGVPLGGGLPTVEPEAIARAVLSSLETRRSETPVPGYLAGWDLIDAVVPERVMSIVRTMLRERRALTSVDAEGRREYEERVARHADQRSVLASKRNPSVS